MPKLPILFPFNKKREPERIDRILALIKKLWLCDMDLRFFQLVFIIQSMYSDANSGFEKVEGTTGIEISKTGYNFSLLEDDQVETLLAACYDKLNKTRKS